ncbi:hypothetical protein [Miniimonas sp. S16]|uniref:hypothetical protein n=1 Tax=Miniimonas sp. S16 TaxID=2171623 RepID=UPI00131F3E27|nr:hypothetical protein [Miniimonas sp. S16]
MNLDPSPEMPLGEAFAHLLTPLMVACVLFVLAAAAAFIVAWRRDRARLTMLGLSTALFGVSAVCLLFWISIKNATN